jgi:thymidylate synthase
MITEHTDLYAEYLKIKVKHTRYENKAERKIDSLQKEIERIKNPPQKRGGKVAAGIDSVKT